ncbi:MAG TPA: type I-C CRISPR-associated protein Cas7/Csd2 [Dehalococcoidia bacterium]|nr:type I-C CRISPR-associated protein Cas7/Csd2 [Dehalococcoidia bacterium]
MTTATTTIHTDPARRHDFVLLFDVQDGNPNGDPDAGNLPRVDPETMQGLVTDVALKRKVRDYIDILKGDDGRFKIYVQAKGIALNTQHERAYTALGKKSTGAKQDKETVDAARAWMCENFYDVRMFGAVMTTGVNCGQVRGPLQLTFSRSVEPIVPVDHSITRVAITKPEDAKVVVSDDPDKGATGKTTEMGRKSTVPYGLYVGHGFFNPHFAAQTGVTAEDLELFWQALQGMWDLDRSSSRGLMALRGLYVFTHDSKLGNAPAHALFDRVSVRRNEGVEAPRAFTDYTVTVDDASLPQGVTLTRLVG